ncbi:Spo0B domain-containing protein [Clostridium sp. MSJ-11]|uniref:Spo0B domain-containing protein n=1 Tax=Clostridium mobile TaxID=2841512 RepID=A0ABS6EEB5_9CLOT|nr:Spo0B domain-containing protein [Clostridium mobile]MBU5483555.1 Spo0B domain-containing protein [Clostridium mobile]
MGDLEKTIELLRKQRHDFMNDLQIIYGYLQMGREDRAREAIKKLSMHNENISEIYSLGDSYLAYSLEENIRRILGKNVDVNIDIEISNFSKPPFEIDYDKKINLVNNIFNKVEKSELNSLHIYFFEDEIGQSLFIGNNEELIDEMNWMESWEKLSIEIEGISVYRCIYGDNIAYRIIFIND